MKPKGNCRYFILLLCSNEAVDLAKANPFLRNIPTKNRSLDRGRRRNDPARYDPDRHTGRIGLWATRRSRPAESASSVSDSSPRSRGPGRRRVDNANKLTRTRVRRQGSEGHAAAVTGDPVGVPTRTPRARPSTRYQGRQPRGHPDHPVPGLV